MTPFEAKLLERLSNAERSLAIAEGERQWTAQCENALKAGDALAYWQNYRAYLLWCKASQKGFISSVRKNHLLAIELTIKELEDGRTATSKAEPDCSAG